MTSIAFIVDGDMEKRFINDACKGCHIRKVGNGDRYLTNVLAKKIMAEINLLSNRVHQFVILLDLERRAQTPSEFARDIRAELMLAGLQNESVIIVIKDKEVEDWILADPQAISEVVGMPVSTDGLSGKGDLSRLLRKHSIRYNEVTVGFQLMKRVYCSRAASAAPSLAYLRANFPGSCWWLNR